MSKPQEAHIAKLTKAQSKAHRGAEELLAKEVLTLDEKIFVYENWNEAALHDKTRAGACFTPLDLANDFKLEVPGPRILDICVGIGVLSFCKLHFQSHDPEHTPQLTCVVINPDYVRVGRKLLPEANWICGDSLRGFRFPLANARCSLRADARDAARFEADLLKASALSGAQLDPRWRERLRVLPRLSSGKRCRLSFRQRVL